MHAHRRITPLLIAAASCVPCIAVAQGVDSALFHRGQWGTEFVVSGGFFSAGALRFTSQGHAWLVDLGASLVHASGTSGGISNSGNAGAVAIEFGTRGYHQFSHRVYRLNTLGVTFNYARQSTNGGPITRTTGGGLFGDLGAVWFVTPHLGVGARWRATLSYLHLHASNLGTSATINQVQLGLGTVQITGQLTF